MMGLTKKVVLVIAIFIVSCSIRYYSQEPNRLLNAVYSKLNKAKDYSANVNIKVDLPFIKMLPINAVVYFKQKDKFKVDSKSIALVPKQGFVQITNLISDTNSYTVLQQGYEQKNNIKMAILNLIPLIDTSDIILGKLWIDESRKLVMKSQITTKSNGTILTEYTYGNHAEFGLPDVMNFEIDIKKFKIPKGLAADINTTKTKTNDTPPKKGKIIIKLSNYVINKGISDAIFKK